MVYVPGVDFQRPPELRRFNPIGSLRVRSQPVWSTADSGVLRLPTQPRDGNSLSDDELSPGGCSLTFFGNLNRLRRPTIEGGWQQAWRQGFVPPLCQLESGIRQSAVNSRFLMGVVVVDLGRCPREVGCRDRVEALGGAGFSPGRRGFSERRIRRPTRRRVSAVRIVAGDRRFVG